MGAWIHLNFLNVAGKSTEIVCHVNLNLSSVRFSTTRDFQMTLLIFAEWKGEHNQGGGGGLKRNIGGREENGVLWVSVLHMLPNSHQQQTLKLMIQGVNDELAHCYWPSSPQLEMPQIIKNVWCSLTLWYFTYNPSKPIKVLQWFM